MKDRTQRQQNFDTRSPSRCRVHPVIKRMKACSCSGVQSGILPQQPKKAFRFCFLDIDAALELIKISLSTFL